MSLFVGRATELGALGSDLVVERIMRGWSTYRGHAVEPVVREGLERLLADVVLGERLGGARHVGSWWRRDHAVEVDLVGADAPEPSRVAFIGSIKWRENELFAASEMRDLAGKRAAVPGAESAKLLSVSRAGVRDDLGADATFGRPDLACAGRRRTEGIAARWRLLVGPLSRPRQSILWAHVHSRSRAEHRRGQEVQGVPEARGPDRRL